MTSDRPDVAQLVPPVARLLDVGCNEGHFGSVIRARGTEVWGIEPDERAAALAVEKLDRVICGLFPEDLPSTETFDCIAFNDSLEHMPDPLSALRRARRHLTDGGCVVASMPNVRHISVVSPLLRRGRWDYSDWGILDRTHLRFFTKSTMRELFESAGFRVEQQLPSYWGGEPSHFLRFLGKRSEEFLAEQYLMFATMDCR